MRWEKERGLPVRRHGNDKGASVYAYPGEIEAWRGRKRKPLWKKPKAWAAIGAVAAAAAAIAYGPILNPRDPVASASEDSMRAEQVWADSAARTTRTSFR